MSKECVNVTYDKIGRIYEYADGTKYYSVTTMLGATADKWGIVKWRRRVGEEEANRQCTLASVLGEEFHLLGEHYLLGTKPPKVNPLSTHVFNKHAAPILDEHVTKVVSVEEALCTEKFKLAGRADAVLVWDGDLAIFDFKLLNNIDKQWLRDYWLQTAIYAQCWYEMYGVRPKKLVLLVGSKPDLCAVYYKSYPKIHMGKVNQRVQLFQSMI